MSRMVEVVIDSVRVSLTNQQRIVVLRESNVERYLPIWIGPYEAEAITIALQEIEVARPQTHDLLKNLLQSINARLLRVEVIALREDVFFGNLVVELNDGRVLNIDCRPSDALALSVRAHVPILVAKEVMENASVVPEQENEAEEHSPASNPPEEIIEEEAVERLSVFEDFLQNLDIDTSSDEDEEEEDDEDRPNPAA
ncbi:MAG TPA: bifunctional nuclease family protein [Levilinea sp.]|nr:bifunctional nuclease family protein [Levilinea sp.]